MVGFNYLIFEKNVFVEDHIVHHCISQFIKVLNAVGLTSLSPFLFDALVTLKVKLKDCLISVGLGV